MDRTARVASLVFFLTLIGSNPKALAGWSFSKNKPASSRAKPASVPLTQQTLQRYFPSMSSARIRNALSVGGWIPKQQWLESEGKKYGRLLIVSDLHPSTGRDPTTLKVNPAEDFKNDEQEVDFRRMMQTQWKESRRDHRVRTLVLNGDALEFIQTTRGNAGQALRGRQDRYGPLNTPENVITKLEGIFQGHPGLADTYAEHLFRGHRLVYVPGNHDRAMIHPSVRTSFLRNLEANVAEVALGEKSFHPEVGKHSRKKLALKEARRIVEERFEFHPWFFLVGDVAVRHGHETDQFNSFATPFGEYYHPSAKTLPMEGTVGDYNVKAVFNSIERRKPWTDNNTSSWEMFKAVLQYSKGNPLRLARAFSYILTREGKPTDASEQLKEKRRTVQDVRRYVREFGLLEKFNTLRPTQERLSEAQLVSTLLRYESKGAKPLLSHFSKEHGFWRRMATLLRFVPRFIRSKKTTEREQEMTDILFRDLNLSTMAVGHDHKFRIEPRLLMETAGGGGRRVSVMDTATWTDRLPDLRRETTFIPAERRGVMVVDFDKKGSHARLMNYDPLRGLQLVNVLESEQEAHGL